MVHTDCSVELSDYRLFYFICKVIKYTLTNLNERSRANRVGDLGQHDVGVAACLDLKPEDRVVRCWEVGVRGSRVQAVYTYSLT